MLKRLFLTRRGVFTIAWVAVGVRVLIGRHGWALLDPHLSIGAWGTLVAFGGGIILSGLPMVQDTTIVRAGNYTNLH